MPGWHEWLAGALKHTENKVDNGNPPEIKTFQIFPIELRNQ